MNDSSDAGGQPSQVGGQPSQVGTQADHFEVIPAIDLLDGQVVRLRGGDFDQRTTYGTDPVAFALQWVRAGAAWLHLVDLQAAVAGEPVQESALRRVIERCGVACEVAGGIRTHDTFARVLGWGAGRVVMGTALLRDPTLARVLVDEFGAGRIVAAIDVREGVAIGSGWVPGSSGLPFIEALASLRDAGVSTFEVTAIARDGGGQGPDLELLTQAAAVVGSMRVIASGGVATAKNVATLAAHGFGGAILGRALYDGTLGLRDAAEAAARAIQ
jgi:phosphoribosylformimino-5-aminoimidazole carboxamide ribotide isomerase